MVATFVHVDSVLPILARQVNLDLANRVYCFHIEHDRDWPNPGWTSLVVLMIFVYWICFCVAGEVFYEFYFARYYGNHMVLQRAPSRAIVWGYGPYIDGNTTVKVTLKTDAGFYSEYRTLIKYTGNNYR